MDYLVQENLTEIIQATILNTALCDCIATHRPPYITTSIYHCVVNYCELSFYLFELSHDVLFFVYQIHKLLCTKWTNRIIRKNVHKA